MINRILAIAALLLFGFFASAAQGATAISFSEPDNTYGWCTGYSTSAAPGCAREWCEKSNGQQCELALVCDAGWNAVAFADSSVATGFGASCDVGSMYNARIIALTNCIVASQAVCFVDSTFDGSGNERNKQSNREFDLTWYVQGLLHGLGYDPGSTDGEFGGRTRSAIKSFQADMGIDQTGEITEDLFYILLTKNGGIGFLVAGMQELQKSFTTDETSRSFSAAAAPLGTLTYSDELRLRTTAVQRILLGDYLRYNDRDCPVPAASAELTDAENGIWTIECNNGGSYTLTLSADGKSDTIADNNAPPQQPETEVAQTDTGTPNKDKTAPADTTTNDAGIAFSHSAPDDGWSVCTGTVIDASDCAQASCENQRGGTACQTVLTCEDRGWSAAAISGDDLRGMGFSCGYTTFYGARNIALIECLHETRSICRLAATIDPDGNATTDEDDDLFTITYDVQAMLSILGFYKADLTGVADDTTRDAAIAFQTQMGVEPTGVIDEDLYDLAYYGVLGQKAFVFVMSRDIYDTMNPADSNHHYGTADRPWEELTFDEEVATLGDDAQLRALAVAISTVEGFPCTIPASSATRDGVGKWTVECAEGTTGVTLDGFAINVTRNADTTPTPTPPSNGKEKSPGPTRGKDKG